MGEVFDTIVVITPQDFLRRRSNYPRLIKWLPKELLPRQDRLRFVNENNIIPFFEKGMSVREDHKNLFDNKEYQSKLSARRMLEIAQEEFRDGYKEVWNV